VASRRLDGFPPLGDSSGCGALDATAVNCKSPTCQMNLEENMNDLSSKRGRRGLRRSLALIAASAVLVPTAASANTAPIARDDTFPVDTAIYTRDGSATVPAPASCATTGIGVGPADFQPGDECGQRYRGAQPGWILHLYAEQSQRPVHDSFTYQASDGLASTEATVDLPVTTGLDVTLGQNKFNIMMNYELGMHCTGFEFAYCCVLPPYKLDPGPGGEERQRANDDDFPSCSRADPAQNKTSDRGDRAGATLRSRPTGASARVRAALLA